MFEIPGFWCGIIGFAAFWLYDINNLAHNNDRLETLYPVGAGMLGLAYIMELPNSIPPVHGVVRIIAIVLAVASFAFLFYVTFGVGKRYIWKQDAAHRPHWWEHELADTGIYALCRHPAVLAWWLFVIFMWLATGFEIYYSVVYLLLGWVLAYYEDSVAYPVLMKGYEQYKHRTPFLFPNKKSIERCKATWGKKGLKK